MGLTGAVICDTMMIAPHFTWRYPLSSFPFPHDLHVYILGDNNYETAYYVHDRKKYKRVREIGHQGWEDTIEQEISSDLFWMVVACFEHQRSERHGLVGMG